MLTSTVGCSAALYQLTVIVVRTQFCPLPLSAQPAHSAQTPLPSSNTARQLQLTELTLLPGAFGCRAQMLSLGAFAWGAQIMRV